MTPKTSKVKPWAAQLFQVPQRAVLYDDNLLQEIAMYYNPNPNPPQPPRNEARQNLNAKFEASKFSKEDIEFEKKKIWPMRKQETEKQYKKRIEEKKKALKRL